MRESQILEAIDNLRRVVDGRVVTTDAVAVINNVVSDAITRLESVNPKTGGDSLLLKWGGWKSWHSDNPKIQALMKEHNELGLSASAIMQEETDRQKELLCEIVDLIDGVIQNDWDGEYYTRSKAKKYIMGIGS